MHKVVLVEQAEQVLVEQVELDKQALQVVLAELVV